MARSTVLQHKLLPLLLLVVLLISVTKVVAESIITVPPVDTTGCYGGISTFYCESNRSDVLAMNWLIDSSSITEQDKETRGITINNDNSLSIMGLPINNGIHIGCTVGVSTPPYVETKGAIFTVTDPSPIHNLTIQFNNDIMTVTWLQPSCVPVNHCYHVTINNESMNVTNTTIQYTVSSCQSYTVSVTVMDTIQPQYQSETVNGTNIGVLEIQLVDPTPIVTFATPDVCIVTLPIRVNMTNIPSSCQIKLSEIFTQYVPDDDTMDGEYILTDMLESYDDTTGMGMFRFDPYDKRLKGNYLLSPQSIPGTSIESDPLDFNISTFNVQNFSITPLSDGTTNITCVFAINSFADGCNVVFTNTITKYNIIITKSDKDNATTNSHIINDNYNVDVYDVIYGVVGQYPAYTQSDVIIAHYNDDRTSPTVSSTITPSMSLKSSPTMTATDPVTNPVSSLPNYIDIGCSISGVIVILLVVVIVIGLIVLRIKFVRYEDGKHSLRVRSEQAFVRKPRANQHNYVDPVAIQTQSPFIHNNEESEYFQHPSTFIHGARRNSSPPPPPPTYPPPDYNQINETMFIHPYTVIDDIHESSTNNDYISHTTFVSQELPTQYTFTTNGSTDNSYSQTPLTCSSVISIDTHHAMDKIMDEINVKLPLKYNFEQRSNEPNILRPPTGPVTPLPKPTVGVPEGPKLQESHYAELQLEGYQRPFQRIPEDPVAYLSVITKKNPNTPPIPQKQQQQQQQQTVINVNHSSNDDNDDYTTEPAVVSDTNNDGDFVIPMDISQATQRFKDGIRTGGTATSLVSNTATCD